MYFYLSLPVFSHWQGRLDPRAMILGRTRRGGRAESGGDRGRGLRGGGLLAEGGTTHLKGLQEAGIGIQKVSIQKPYIVYACYLSYFTWPPQLFHHNVTTYEICIFFVLF